MVWTLVPEGRGLHRLGTFVHLINSDDNRARSRAP